MSINNLVSNQQTSERLAKLGVEQSGGKMYWGNTIGQKDQSCWRLYTKEQKEIPDSAMEYYRAFFSDEILEMLPETIDQGDDYSPYYLNMHKARFGKEFQLRYGTADSNDDKTISIRKKTFVEALASLLEHCIKNNLIKV